ncbi:MAG: hypothetical protein ACO1RA_16635 [Planctomycetaceae bacterium]
MYRWVFLFIALLMMGCGAKDKPNLVKAKGKVVQNGTAVTAGNIIFYPNSANSYTKDNPSSLLELDGSFSMKTFPFGDGVAPGKYKVTLAPQLAGRLQLPDYANPEKTPWTLEVPEGGVENLVFEVKP